MKPQTDILALFGTRIRELRLGKGYSQEKLAEAAQLDRTYISSIERGKRNVSLRNLHLLATALNVSISDLLDGIQ